MKKVIVILLSTTFLYSCSSDLDKDKVKIGVALPLSGTSSSYGEYARYGLDLAMENISNVELVYEDTKCAAMEATNVMNKLVNIDGIKLVIGEICSHASLAMAPIAQKNRVLMLAPGTTASSFTEYGDFMFRMKLGADVDSKEMARAAKNDLGIEEIAVLAVQNDYGLGVKEDFKKEYLSLGGKILLEEDFLLGERDFRTLLNRIKKSGAPAVMIASFSSDLGIFLRQAKELAMDNILFLTHNGGVTDETFKLAGDAIEGLIFVDEFDKESARDETVKFLERFREKYDKEPDMFAANSYDALMILSMMVDKCGDDSSCVRDELFALRDYEGVTARLSFDEKGNIIRPMFLRIIKDGRYSKYEEK